MLCRIDLRRSCWPLHVLDFFNLQNQLRFVECALSPMNINRWPTAHLKSQTWDFSISSLYLWALTVNLQQVWSLGPFDMMPAQTKRTPLQNLSFSVWCHGIVLRFLKTVFWRESICKLNPDSSENNTLLHTFKLQCRCSWIHFKRAFRCTAVSDTQTGGRLAWRPVTLRLW